MVLNLGYSHYFNNSTKKIYCNAEWQANEFAGRLLLPDSYIALHQDISAVGDIAELFGVSYECAQTRMAKSRK